MAHTNTSADNSFALSTQTNYEMHKKTIVQIPATYARMIYNVANHTLLLYVVYTVS